MHPETVAEYVSTFGKAVELCSGYYAEVAKLLHKAGKLVCVCDINEEARSKFSKLGIKFVVCDIFDPCLDILEYCRKADVVYSIRPPPELWNSIAKLAENCNCVCVIRPMKFDLCNVKGFKLEYYKDEIFYVSRV